MSEEFQNNQSEHPLSGEPPLPVSSQETSPTTGPLDSPIVEPSPPNENDIPESIPTSPIPPYTSPYQSLEMGNHNTPYSNSPPNYPYQRDQWRQNNRQPYQWSLEQIQSATQTTQTNVQKGKGIKVFLGLLCAIVLILVTVFTVYGMYVAATGNTLHPPSSIGGNPPSSASSSAAPDISIFDNPFSLNGSNPDGTLTNQEIFKNCSPSVVGVIGYMDSIGILSGQVSEGSGIIMTEDGYILTNAHVLSDPKITSIEIIFSSGEAKPATIIGMDTQTDIAVVKVEAQGLNPAEFGNSDQLEVGERVIAIGNPGGMRFANTFTQGWVSAIDRTIYPEDAGYSMETIQTDAAVNPGNSGGPMINSFGLVVGVISAKSENHEGISFAIPINTALPIAQDLIANGRVTNRAMLGITARMVTASYAEYYGIPMGLEVQATQPGSDIDKKGVQPGDIITHIGSIPIYSFDASADALSEYKPGDTVQITIYRRTARGQSNTFNLEIVLIGS